MKISLIGFMATGKSTVGKLLSQKMGLKFLETDQLIELSEDKSIPQIFAQYGENYFRQLEKEILNEIIKKRDSFVLSTGGGIVLARENRSLLKQETIPFLLQADPETIYQRTKNEENRPLLAQPDPKKTIETLLAQRAEYYNQFKPKIKTDHKTPVEIAAEIMDYIGADFDESD